MPLPCRWWCPCLSVWASQRFVPPVASIPPLRAIVAPCPRCPPHSPLPPLRYSCWGRQGFSSLPSFCPCDHSCATHYSGLTWAAAAELTPSTNITESQNHRITESQNHRMFGVGRDLCGSSSPTPLPKQGHLQLAAQDLVQADIPSAVIQALNLVFRSCSLKPRQFKNCPVSKVRRLTLKTLKAKLRVP